MTLQPNGTLRIAVPNKGSLSQAANEMLRASGYRQRQDAKELTLVDAHGNVSCGNFCIGPIALVASGSHAVMVTR